MRTISLMLNIISALFVVECLIKVIVMGFCPSCKSKKKDEDEEEDKKGKDKKKKKKTKEEEEKEKKEKEEEEEPGPRTYLTDSWNILDFIIVLFSILTWVLEASTGGNMEFVRGFRALRALRPLRVVSKNEGIKTVVNSLLESIPALLNVLLIVLLFLMVFGILGI